MTGFAFLPTLSNFDVERAAHLIQLGYGPSTSTTTPEDLKRIQHELFEIQKRPEAWGLVIPLLNHDDQNVQFFGAHTAQVKVARDWDAFPQEHAERLRDLLVQLTAHSIAIGRPNFILRKLFVALASLAIKLVPGRPSRWENWIISACKPSQRKEDQLTEYISSWSLWRRRWVGRICWGLRSAAGLEGRDPMVVQAIAASVNQPRGVIPISQVQAALQTLQAWMNIFPADNLVPFIPTLIGLLDSSDDDDSLFLAASDALQEILSKSPLSDGAGTKTLTEPLLLWLDTLGSQIVSSTVQSNDVSETSHSLCKLLAALGDHSALYLARTFPPLPSLLGKTKGYLVQTFLRLFMAYTGLQGFYGEDEEESELTLSFCKDPAQVTMAKSVYIELVQILRKKVAFPPSPTGWNKDQIDKFNVYRRDVGDTLINAFYVLRDDYAELLHQRTPQAVEWSRAQLARRRSNRTASLRQDILGRLPTTGHNRLRKTALSVIGTYSTWFTTYSKYSPPPSSSSVSGDSTSLLLNVLNYVVTALTDPALCLQAAVALRNLCDTNRKALAPHIVAFGQLHNGLEGIPDSEKIEAIVSPVVQKLVSALQTASSIPDEARAVVILQLEILAAISKGLTRTTESLYGDDDEDPAMQAEIEQIKTAREEPRMQRIRDDTFSSIRSIVNIWSVDAEISHTLSDLFKSITSLPSDITLIFSQLARSRVDLCRRPEAAHSNLALPRSDSHCPVKPPAFDVPLETAARWSAQAIVSNVLPVLLQCGLSALAVPGAMEANPDIVQEFFSCMDRVAQDFTKTFYIIPPGLLDALMQCAISSLALQERYSLVAAANFMSNLIHRSSLTSELNTHKMVLLSSHGRAITRAILQGFAGVAPRSVVPNLIEMLGALMNRSSGTDGGPATVAKWMQEILFSEDFVPSKAGPETKEKFIKAVVASRSLKKTREAAQQFALVARGLEGSSFGYASVIAM
ncbi:ARM repeat-containing protein [Coprinellus micaceus]|uniref:ARM repeat-containing protein n=1 Tax=Coprinellus micaceus TaxID=71717 RepID=A0A4Y7SEF1_COPMI|nr:ARM repeat-containing protein [Coprinellus micaceus]